MYESITKSEYEKLHTKALKFISKKNANQIDKVMSCIKYDKSEYMFGNTYSFYKKVKKNNYRCQLTISECDDEWFVVRGFSNQYYKCDQIEGLILLLVDFLQ